MGDPAGSTVLDGVKLHSIFLCVEIPHRARVHEGPADEGEVCLLFDVLAVHFQIPHQQAECSVGSVRDVGDMGGDCDAQVLACLTVSRVWPQREELDGRDFSVWHFWVEAHEPGLLPLCQSFWFRFWI